MADNDKVAQPEQQARLSEGVRRGLDQLVAVSPPADAMSPQDAMAAAEPPPPQDAKE